VSPVRNRDRGAATTLSMVVLTPVFVVLGFAAFQAAMWSHARTEARVVARDTATAIARSGVPTSDARDSARAVLLADTDVRDVRVDVVDDGRLVTVTVYGRAPGIIRGTSSGLSVTAVVPIEGIRS
jgi:Flp pilus assembly protein TadG